MRLAMIVFASCAASGASIPIISHEPIDDPRAVPIAFEFPDNANGTELLLTLLAQARTANVTAVSELEIQVGSCVREVSTEPQAMAPVQQQDPGLDRIVVRAFETRYTCKKLVDQVLVSTGAGFSDAKMEIREACEHTPIEHVVTRYRFEVDHGFVPPDWREIQRWTRAALTFGPPHCGGASRNEIRAHFHVGPEPAPYASAPSPIAGPTARPVEIIALVNRAKQAAEAHQPIEATRLSAQALAQFGDGRVLDTLDNTAALELATWIAAAQYFAVEEEVDLFLRREVPVTMDEAWATGVGTAIDRIAERYARIQDRVRLPVVAPWLHAGAMSLGRLHRHAARMLEQGDQVRAAEIEREKARALMGDGLRSDQQR